MGTRADRSIHEGVIPPSLHIYVAVDVRLRPEKLPLSMRYWLTALYMVFMSLLRSASLLLPSCLAGLMATMTIPANIAMMATTRSISRSVKALLRVFLVLVCIWRKEKSLLVSKDICVEDVNRFVCM